MRSLTRCPRPRRCPGGIHQRKVQVHASPLEKIGQVLKEKARGDFERVFKGTEKTRQQLSVVEELLTYWNIDKADEQLEELEDALICVDFGPKTAFKIADEIRDKILKGALKSGEDLRAALRQSLLDTLTQRGGTADLQLPAAGLAVLLIVGVNGAGKTTTIGKLAHKFASTGAQVMLGSGDTFRAAAFEQLGEWGVRAGATMGPYSEGDTPRHVLEQTVGAAQEAGMDIVLCDTSGRLHTNWRLMDELQDVEVGIKAAHEGAPHEVLLVLDGSTGLNMMNQAKEFSGTVGVTGIILTKLDGAARGGAVVSVVDQLGIPVKFVGVGEGLEDLQPFDAENFVNSLFPETGQVARSIADVAM